MQIATSDLYTQFTLQIAELLCLNDQYDKILAWTTSHDKLKKEWVRELAKLNEEADKGFMMPVDKLLSLDKKLEVSNIFKAEKQLQKEELENKIHALATHLFTIHEVFKKDFETGELKKDQYLKYLKNYQAALDTGGNHVFYINVASRGVRIAVKEHLINKAT